MIRPYSNDLRERVVVAVETGHRRFVRSEVVAALSKDGSFAPGKRGGHRRRVLEPHRAYIIARIEQASHLTLDRLKDELPARGVAGSHNTV